MVTATIAGGGCLLGDSPPNLIAHTFPPNHHTDTTRTVRIAYLQTALKEQIFLGRDHVSASDRPVNYYWYTSYGLMWSAIECNVRVCCCCALVLKPLLQKLKKGGSSLGSSSKGVFSKRSQQSGDALANGNGVAALSPPPDGSFMSNGPSPKSPVMKRGNIQAMLDVDEDCPEEDQFDIMAFFAAGPPGSGGEPTSPRMQTSPRLGGNGFGNVNGNTVGLTSFQGGSPDSDSITMGAPLASPPTRLSTHHFLTAPVRWITKESAEPPELAQAPTQRFFDVVQMGSRKPLTELTPREAWWPVMFGKWRGGLVVCAWAVWWCYSHLARSQVVQAGP